jgi:hypothetical protein
LQQFSMSTFGACNAVELHGCKTRQAIDCLPPLLPCCCSFDNRGMPFSVGMLSYSNAAEVRPKAGHFTVWTGCCYKGFQPLTTFGVRVETDYLGQLVFIKKAPTPFDSEWRAAAAASRRYLLGGGAGMPLRLVAKSARTAA